MHLFALDPTGRIIAAKQASKQQNYICLECRGVVRRRGGVHRVPHFFHLNPPETCRQQGKSLVHLQVQIQLQSSLPEGEVQLEYAFPSISRIADVAWLNKKIIFEVQCSFISPEEIRERQEDYHSQGFTVIWILHDFRYNQWRLTAAEDFLDGYPHYFTNITAEGQGCIYDQYQLIRRGIRHKKLLSLKIDPSRPIQFDEESQDPIPLLLKNRRNWPLYFEGDAWDQKEQYEEVLADFNERSEVPSFIQLIYIIGSFLKEVYGIAFRTLLERICK